MIARELLSVAPLFKGRGHDSWQLGMFDLAGSFFTLNNLPDPTPTDSCLLLALNQGYFAC